MFITETIEFWVLFHMFELTILGQVIISNHLKQNVMKSILNLLSGLVLGIVIVIGVLIFQGDVKFFWASVMIAVLIWMASLYVNKRSDDKIDQILQKINRIEERLDN